jgi:hypothetical protein
MPEDVRITVDWLAGFVLAQGAWLSQQGDAPFVPSHIENLAARLSLSPRVAQLL